MKTATATITLDGPSSPLFIHIAYEYEPGAPAEGNNPPEPPLFQITDIRTQNQGYDLKPLLLLTAETWDTFADIAYEQLQQQGEL